MAVCQNLRISFEPNVWWPRLRIRLRLPFWGLGRGGLGFSDTPLRAEISTMRCTTRFWTARSSLFALICISLLAAGCSKSEQDDGTFNASRLPRVSGAKEVFASAATTIFTSPDSIAQTADTLDKALAAGGWQKYIAPNTAYANDPNMRIASLKKGTQALSVYITIAPAQNNATSVQYAALLLKTDLPFIGDASNIEYSPERALLTLVTG